LKVIRAVCQRAGAEAMRNIGGTSSPIAGTMGDDAAGQFDTPVTFSIGTV
jgi:hypothetical protein